MGEGNRERSASLDVRDVAAKDEPLHVKVNREQDKEGRYWSPSLQLRYSMIHMVRESGTCQTGCVERKSC